MKYIIWIPVMLGGIFAIIGGYILFFDFQFVQQSQYTDGKVVDLQFSRGTFYPVVRYEYAEGKTMDGTGNTGSSPAAYDIGEEVGVYFDPADPSNFMIDSFFDMYIFPLAFGGFGGLFMLIPFGILFFGKRRLQQIENLKVHGLRISADVTAVRLNEKYSVNRRHPFIVECQALDITTNTVRMFESENFWYNPGPFMEGRKKIEVLVDANNPKKYWVDTDFLPKEGGYIAKCIKSLKSRWNSRGLVTGN